MTFPATDSCYYCGLTHDHVEAGGIWHCPNFLCPGPGAACWRMQCTSYTEVSGGRHTVDPAEMVRRAESWLETVGDEPLRDHVRLWLPHWRGQGPRPEVVHAATGETLVVDQEESE